MKKLICLLALAALALAVGPPVWAGSRCLSCGDYIEMARIMRARSANCLEVAQDTSNKELAEMLRSDSKSLARGAGELEEAAADCKAGKPNRLVFEWWAWFAFGPIDTSKIPAGCKEVSR